MPPFMSQAPRPYSTPSRTSPRERIGLPFAGTDRHHVGVAGEADMRRPGADAREQVLDLAIAQRRHGEAEALSASLKHGLRAGVGRVSPRRSGSAPGPAAAGRGSIGPLVPQGEGDAGGTLNRAAIR